MVEPLIFAQNRFSKVVRGQYGAASSEPLIGATKALPSAHTINTMVASMTSSCMILPAGAKALSGDRMVLSMRAPIPFPIHLAAL